MAFWGCILKPGESKAADLPGGQILHVSQVCLHEPKAGKNYLQIQVRDSTYTVACLEKDKREHDPLDLMFALEDEPKFFAKGGSHIHLVGYMEPEEDVEELLEEATQKKAAPAAKAAASPKALAAPKASPKAAPAKSPKTAPAASPKLAAAKKAAANTEAEDDSDDDLLLEGEEGEEEEPRVKDPPIDEDKAAKPKAAAKGKAEKGKAAAKAEEKAAGKRAAPAEAPGGPEKKKAKDDTEPLKPDEGEYVEKLVSYLKANGKTNIGLLGSKVQRPKNLPKLKDILSKNAGKFKVTGDAVEAK